MSITAIRLERMRPEAFEDDLNPYPDFCRRGSIHRVFIAGLHGIYTKDRLIDTNPESFKAAIAFFNCPRSPKNAPRIMK